MKNDLRNIVCAAIACAVVGCTQEKSDVPAPVTPAASAKPAASSPPASVAKDAAIAAPAAAPGKSGGTIDKATTSAIGSAIDGEILKNDQNDFYRFEVASKLRDLAIVRLQNQSNTLRPYIRFYDGDRKQLVESYDGTPGASVERTLSLEPGETFYVQVLAYNSVGKYTLSVTPQKAFDSHEPNDDALSATPGKIGAAIEGSMMDDKDSDWFRISGAASKTVHVTLDNLSSTLRPYVKVYSSTKSQMLEKYDGTAGANLDFTVNIEPGKDFYLAVVPYGSTGKYRLTATAVPDAPASPASPAK